MTSKLTLARALASVLLALLAAAATSCKPSRKPVAVLTAASLARAFGELEEVVERKHKDLDVRLEVGGSQQLCRKLVELGGKADVLAVADYKVIDRICRPGQAEFNIHFATNSIALAHLEHSRHTGDITTESWHEVLLKPEVRLGLVDADAAPIGYRTLLVWELAAAELGLPDLPRKLRARVAREHVAPHEGELLQLLQSRAIDYAFIYRSTAEEHNLKVVQLPASYNLGATDRAEAYARVSVPAQMKRGQAARRVQGAPVTYGVTIPVEPPNPRGAEAFVAALLGPAGRRILKQTGFAPLEPARCGERSKLPPKIRPLTR